MYHCIISLFLLLIFGINETLQFFGSTPLDYSSHQRVVVYVNKWTSSKTHIPYDHYHFPICRPEEVYLIEENIGQILSGDRTENCDLKIFMDFSVGCSVYCARTYNAQELKLLKKAINDKYMVNLLIDDLPVTQELSNDVVPVNVEKGFPIGKFENNEYEIFNHWHFKLRYHSPSLDSFRVVGVEVIPKSVHISNVDSQCQQATDLPDEKSETFNINAQTHEITWTYSVEWIKDDTITWATRWDVYFKSRAVEKSHWFTLGNSIIIGIFLTILVALILIRTVYRDIAKYNTILPISETREEELEESGWKLVHGDVFRPPYRLQMLFCAVVGNGLQLFFMALVVLFLFSIGFIDKGVRGSLITIALLIFVLLGGVNGYFSSKLYKYFDGRHWKSLTFLTSLLFPGMIFFIGLIMNIFFYFAKSSRSLTIGNIFLLTLLWFGVSTPLVFIGSFYGLRSSIYEVPCTVRDIPREVPPVHWALTPITSVLLAGLVPFSATFMELNEIMESIWSQYIYTIISSIFIIFLITMVSICEISVVTCYFQLVNEDYHWWWRSIFTGGSIGIYIFLYSIIYAQQLEMNQVTTYAIYYSSMLMFTIFVSMLGGAIGFYSCFWFNKKIYGSIKVD